MDKVLLILVDGMRPDAVTQCGDPAFEAYFKEGAYTFQAQTTFPPVTLPCHMSLFHSVAPDRHGVTTNTFVPQNHPIEGLIEAIASAKKRTAFFYMWEQLRDICTPDGHFAYTWFMSWEYYRHLGLDWRATKACEEHVRELAPEFVFLYLGETDECGHQHGWMSKEYLASVKNAWDCIRYITDVVADEYSIIVSADHGGHGRNHGDDIPEDMTIPMCFRGDRFPAGTELKNASILDIAPTVTDLLGVRTPDGWEGKSVAPK